jgi:hypothetical protein
MHEGMDGKNQMLNTISAMPMSTKSNRAITPISKDGLMENSSTTVLHK